MLELEVAQERILSRVQPLASEIVPLAAAAGRFLAQTIVATVDLPGFDNSAMDGYAVRAEDVTQASSEHPVPLRVLAKVAAGESSAIEVTSRTCIRLFTGSPLPHGADAVVMQEDTRLVAADPHLVHVLDRIKPCDNIRFRGEDVKAGSPLFEAGQAITAARIALGAAAGVAHVTVAKRPLVGLIATGSELREVGQKLLPGQIYESNRSALATLVEQTGAKAKVFPLLPDEPGAIQRSLEQALAECDVVATCGGVSVGEFDFVKNAIERLGGKLEFWRVAIKPGKPFAFGFQRGKPLFGLPGNPVSAFVTFLLLVRPALLHVQGATCVSLLRHPGILAEPLVNRGDRRHFVRVAVDDRGAVRLSGIQASHRLSSLASSNGLVDLPPGIAIQIGETVQVLRWE